MQAVIWITTWRNPGVFWVRTAYYQRKYVAKITQDLLTIDLQCWVSLLRNRIFVRQSYNCLTTVVGQSGDSLLVSTTRYLSHDYRRTDSRQPQDHDAQNFVWLSCDDPRWPSISPHFLPCLGTNASWVHCAQALRSYNHDLNFKLTDSNCDLHCESNSKISHALRQVLCILTISWQSSHIFWFDSIRFDSD